MLFHQKRNNCYLFFWIIFFYSCGTSNEKMINDISKKVNIYEGYLLEVNKTIPHFDSIYILPITLSQDRNNRIVWVSKKGASLYPNNKIENPKVLNMIFNVFEHGHYTFAVIRTDRVALMLNNRNKDLEDYWLVYSENLNIDSLLNYKYYEKELPKEKSGWIYKLKDKVYLFSPSPR